MVSKVGDEFLVDADGSGTIELAPDEDCPELAFFPGMDLSRARKLAFVDEFFTMLLRDWEPVTMGEHARRAVSTGKALPTLAPVFPA